MNKTLSGLLVSLMVTAPALAQSVAASPAVHANPAPGEMLIDAAGGRLAPVDRVDDDGSVEIIIDGHVAVVPANTLSDVNGHLTTSLKKNQVLALQ